MKSCKIFNETAQTANFTDFSLIFLHDFILFVVDIHQIRLISLFPTPFDHFHFHGSAGLVPKFILTPCHKHQRDVSLMCNSIGQERARAFLSHLPKKNDLNYKLSNQDNSPAAKVGNQRDNRLVGD